MIFSEKTLAVLKNFSSINSSMLFRRGNIVRSISPQKTILAKEQIDENIERDFAIYDLSKFLGVLSLFNAPEIVLGENSATIVANNQKLVYVYADASTFATPPDKELTLPVPEVMFNLKSADLLKVQRAGHVLQLPEIAVAGDGSTIRLKAVDGETDKTFNVVFKSENLKMLPNDYDLSITSKGISKFECGTLVYMVANEASSSFN
jgi:gp45 sliding clamp, C terminal